MPGGSDDSPRGLFAFERDDAGANKEDVAGRMRALAASFRQREGRDFTPIPFRYREPVEGGPGANAQVLLRQRGLVFGRRVIFVDTKNEADGSLPFEGVTVEKYRILFLSMFARRIHRWFHYANTKSPALGSYLRGSNCCGREPRRATKTW